MSVLQQSLVAARELFEEIDFMRAGGDVNASIVDDRQRENRLREIAVGFEAESDQLRNQVRSALVTPTVDQR